MNNVKYRNWIIAMHSRYPKMKESVIINPSSSTCGNCHEDCDYDEKRHETVLGYGPKNGTKGCGIEWKYVTTQYMGKRDEEATKECRPDLEFWSQFTTYPRANSSSQQTGRKG